MHWGVVFNGCPWRGFSPKLGAFPPLHSEIFLGQVVLVRGSAHPRIVGKFGNGPVGLVRALGPQ